MCLSKSNIFSISKNLLTNPKTLSVKQKKWPGWGLNTGPSRHIPDALTIELSGLYQKSTNLLIMPLPSEQHQNTTSEYTPCKTDTCRGMIKHMLRCLGKVPPDRSLFRTIIDYSVQLLMLYNTQFVNRMCCILLSANLSVPVLCDIVGK